MFAQSFLGMTTRRWCAAFVSDYSVHRFGVGWFVAVWFGCTGVLVVGVLVLGGGLGFGCGVWAGLSTFLCCNVLIWVLDSFKVYGLRPFQVGFVPIPLIDFLSFLGLGLKLGLKLDR